MFSSQNDSHSYYLLAIVSSACMAYRQTHCILYELPNCIELNRSLLEKQSYLAKASEELQHLEPYKVVHTTRKANNVVYNIAACIYRHSSESKRRRS